ncbi:monooxygenase (plasmid) [Sphingobium sp. SCG-1]|jgi:toluene monooxygenase system protein D|uniref:MmoB/DmpM family protein n=1 Tax=Sphingobium sp. SCG-1 TaxID=2072936 RepID=UPI000CD6A4B1|nr:MmoB/DmpM family protein [Sphingobium sp. SCG-1]AUW60567.1 monooxygenase [Sphingobium sp. SCG-1]
MTAVTETKNNRVGPVIRAGDVAKAAQEAIEIDNPGKEIFIDDRGVYIRIECDQECLLTQATMEEVLGRKFEVRELEINLTSFSGQIDVSQERVRFYLTKTY